ncbi:hypothetical protein H6P81_003835 [Aristolochia fimbriata]|uniref:Pentatricopeptide repeat-containing protein n=1 Tax=Aristolochia fimbriata TaxID=158543 RepID=A0AAV7FGR6_ARIFI|nr:hypothetical protein H6P81_003835 [Aristolochia fimbriata]
MNHTRALASSCVSGLWPSPLRSLLINRISCGLVPVKFYRAFSYSSSSQSLSSILFHPYRWDLRLARSSSSLFSVPYCSLGKKLRLLTLPLPFSPNTVSLCTISTENPPWDQTEYCKSNSHCGTTDSDKLCQVIADNSTPDWRMEKAFSQTVVVLSDEVVDIVLQRFRYEEKLAFRFFMWAGRQEGYTHRSQAYTNMIDILSCTRYKAKQFGIVCEILDYMKRKSKTSIPTEALLTILRKYTETHLTEVSKVTKKKRIRVKRQPEISAFNLLVESLCKCSLVDEAEALFYKVKNKVIPDGNTYNILFFGWCRVKIPSKAMKVLEKMIEMGHTPDNFTYNAAMDSFCKAGMVSEALDLFQFMKTKGSTMSSPTAKTYCIMIIALAKCDRMEECFRLLSEMRTSGCVPDVSTYKELIEGMFLAGKVDEAYTFLDEMGNIGYPPDIVTYNCFLKVLCDLKESSEAMRLFQRMVEFGCEPSVHTYNMLITMFFKMGIPDGAFDAWHEMDKRGCARDVDTYCEMIEGLFGSSRVEDACLLLEEVVDKEMKLPYQRFDSFLMHLSEAGNLRAIHTLSDYMRKFYNTAMARRFAVSQKRKTSDSAETPVHAVPQGVNQGQCLLKETQVLLAGRKNPLLFGEFLMYLMKLKTLMVLLVHPRSTSCVLLSGLFSSDDPYKDVEALLAGYRKEPELKLLLPQIVATFGSHKSVPEIIKELKKHLRSTDAEVVGWADEAIQGIGKGAPFSLCLTKNIFLKWLQHEEIKPKWNPPQVEDVYMNEVATLFALLQPDTAELDV